ncbi:phosphate signaling complex protein PhoU [Zavarzinia compransoris]|uniref:Phosphate-specific transport system accessory protein PhoU n=1 Tax=Zavarzinia compransoris TaxID=1264899 RepID=A0A317E9B9_9PROT|nr:phosphate signaling complex protein PhoU [Zavarzinia compransoris]PWR21923.1 phosphate transport system regulatory protein PhoU [Zavarzinia compransoris]TDP47343.1 PhoU-like phosphate uptake regulator [Zavarzinia compransoris]
MAEHIVSAFDNELNALKTKVLRMGGIAEANVAAAVQATVRRDRSLAERTISSDQRIDVFDGEIAELVTRLLALRQPMAVDLRLIVGTLKIATDLERIGDYAKNIAKRSTALGTAIPAQPLHAIPRMGELVLGMIKDVLDALSNEQVDKAVAVRDRDPVLDEIYNSVFRELLTYMMEDPRTITGCTHLLFIAKNLERIGDHATNMAETVYYILTGKRMHADRPKADVTAEIADPSQVA